MNDLIVVGGGAGGISAARAAARRGARTLLVQEGPIGGECTFTGCVPSKALIAAAAGGKTFDEAMRSVHRSIDTIAAGQDDDVFAKEGIEVVHGWATFRAPTELEVDGHRFEARRFVLATGTHPAIPPIDGLDQVDYLTNETVFDLATQPGSLAVLGGRSRRLRTGSGVLPAGHEDDGHRGAGAGPARRGAGGLGGHRRGLCQ